MKHMDQYNQTNASTKNNNIVLGWWDITYPLQAGLQNTDTREPNHSESTVRRAEAMRTSGCQRPMVEHNC